MNLKEFWESKEKIAIHCDTKDKAIQLCNKFHEMGKTWRNGTSYKDYNNWDMCTEDMCYDNNGGYCDKKWYESIGCAVIPFDDIDDFKIIVGGK